MAATTAVQTALVVMGLLALFVGGVVLAGRGVVDHPAHAAGGAAAAATLGAAAWVLHRRRGRRPAPMPGMAAGNFDAASLWVCLRACDLDIGPRALLMGYGAADLIGLLPVTPGGIGLVEGVLIPARSTQGSVAAAPVTLGVLTWRLFEFWLPIPIGGLAYLSLKPAAPPPQAPATSAAPALSRRTGRGRGR